MSSSESDGIFELIGASIIIGGGLVISGLKRFRNTRRVQDTARIPIASAPQGLVEIEGFAWPMTQPFVAANGRQAVYHDFVLEEYVTRNKNSRWETVFSIKRNPTFYVVDNSGVAIVNPLKTEVELSCVITPWKKVPDIYREVVQQLVGKSISGFPPSDSWWSGGQFRCNEKMILVGSPVYVQGSFKSEATKNHSVDSIPLRKFIEKIKKVGQSKAYKQTMLDQNKDGVINDAEAREGFHTAALVSLRAADEESATTALKCFGEVAADENRNLYIADCHEHHLVTRIGAWNLLRVVGGAILVGVGILILILYVQGDLR